VPSDQPFRWLAPILLLFGTPLFFYTVGFWEHSIALAFILAGFLLIKKSTTNARSATFHFLAGLVLGMATILREEGYILMIALVIAHFISYRSFKNVFSLVLGWVLIMCPIWFLQKQLYGHALGIHELYYSPAILKHSFKGLLSNLYVYLYEFHSNELKK